MRLRIVTPLLIASCSSERRESTLAPDMGNEPDTAATEQPETSDANVIDARSGAPRATELTGSVARLVRHPEWGNPAWRPIPASSCPGHCSPMRGWRLEEAERCISPVIVGCMPNSYSTDSAASGIKRKDGVIFGGSIGETHKLMGPDWTGCNAEEASFDGVPVCPSP